VHEPDDLLAGAGPRHSGHVSTTTHGEREFTTNGTESQKYGMDVVVDLSDGVKSQANAHEPGRKLEKR